MSQPGTIKYADVLAMWNKLGNLDPAKTMCSHCGAMSLEGPHDADCPWVKLDRLCAAVEAKMGEQA